MNPASEALAVDQGIWPSGFQFREQGNYYSIIYYYSLLGYILGVILG